ncbi:MAG: hypothetical protein EOO22_01640 [Comamonadaceae bacterium]|nr:MAG: hypothetical protein EOO22_01640 [Comamonadaceae bacterium]
MKFTAAVSIAAASIVLAACSAPTPMPRGDNTPQPTVLLVPVQINDPALASGCWAQFFSRRNFEGDVATLVGPAELQTLDDGAGRTLKREIDSVLVGPRARLQVYEHAMFKDRTVDFPANSREGGLIRKLGFGGRIEAMRLSCS